MCASDAMKTPDVPVSVSSSSKWRSRTARTTCSVKSFSKRCLTREPGGMIALTAQQASGWSPVCPSDVKGGQKPFVVNRALGFPHYRQILRSCPVDWTQRTTIIFSLTRQACLIRVPGVADGPIQCIGQPRYGLEASLEENSPWETECGEVSPLSPVRR